MNYKVLVVDDSKLARMVMASAFRRIRPDWSLIETPNADEALATVSKGAVDIALIDFNMPGTDGLELIAKIRKSYPDVRVVVSQANGASVFRVHDVAPVADALAIAAATFGP